MTKDEQWLAEVLHKQVCKLDHTERCDWYYRDWKFLGSARKLYIKKAKKILKVYKLITVLRVMRQYNDIIDVSTEVR